MRLLFIFSVLILMPLGGVSQTSLTSNEVNAICKKIINGVKAKKFKGKVIVFEFENAAAGKNNSISLFGAYLADLFRSHLSNSDYSGITVISRTDGEKKPINWWSTVINIAGQVVEDPKQQVMVDVLTQLNNPIPSDPIMKGVKGIVTGKISKHGDYFTLIVTFKNKKNSTVLHSVEGKITNLKGYEEMYETFESPKNERKPCTDLDREQFLQFELINCVQKNDKFLECHFRFTSEGRNCTINLIGDHHTKFFDLYGKEYFTEGIKFVDLYGHSVTKTLIKDLPTEEIIVTFQTDRYIDDISELTIRAYSSEIGYFMIKMNDFCVNH